MLVKLPLIFTARKRSFYMCLSVCPGEVWQGGVHGSGGVHGRGACMAGGVHGRGSAWQGACMAGGVCMAGGMHGTHAPPADTMRYGQ